MSRLGRAARTGALFWPMACASYHSSELTVGSARFAARPTADVAILVDLPDRPYEVIGRAHSHCRRHLLFGAGSCSRPELERRLAQAAARLGAEAVYDLRETRFRQFVWVEVDLAGTAIRRTGLD